MTTYSPALASSPPRLDATPATRADYRPRSLFLPVPFLVPLLLSLVSHLSGGIGSLMDMSFLLLTGLCGFFLVLELIHFPKRFGVGGLILFGGVILWFSYDYFNNWYGTNWVVGDSIFRREIVAESVFMHCLFVFAMTIGLLLPFGKLVERAFYLIPDPSFPSFFLWLAIFLFVLGVGPYFIWAAEPWYEAIWLDFIGQRFGGARWHLQGPGGNLNLTLSWGAYIAVLQKAAQFGGTLAVFYAILLARSFPAQLVAWSIWAFWAAMAFGSGTRGQVLAMVLPAAAFLYLKYQARAAVAMRRLSKRAYLWAALMCFAMLVMMQVQSYIRGSTLDEADFSRVQLTKLQGNQMFSEGLLAFELLPETRPFFMASRPGEGVLRPMPQTAFDFATQIIPRTIWNSKPIDQAGIWYNYEFAGSGVTGVNITPGIVAWWYMRYGTSGVFQGGLLFGWMMIIAERVFQGARGRTMPLVLGMAFAAWIFRSYRQIFFHNLYPIILAAIAMYVLIKLVDMLNIRRAS